MVVLNYSGEEINAKIVYYGPGLSGKTTNLEYIHEKMPVHSKGKLVSMKTRTDRTLFFDFLPLELGEINGYRSRFLLYTVPGQVYYNATRKLVLKGADAIVFVADSSRAKLQDNIESLRNLEDNLNEYGMSLDHVPWVIQYNKRDVADAMPVTELHEQLNLLGVPAFEAVAMEGTGVHDTFQGVAGLLFEELRNKLERGEVATGSNKAPGVPAAAVTEEPVATDAVSVSIDSALQEVGGDNRMPVAQPSAPVAPALPAPAVPVPVAHENTRAQSAGSPARDSGAGQPSASAREIPGPAQAVVSEPAQPPAVTAAIAPAVPAAQEVEPALESIEEPASTGGDPATTARIEEAAVASEAARHAEPGEFITGPTQRPSEPIENTPLNDDAVDDVCLEAPDLVGEASPPAESLELSVPLVIPRSRLQGGSLRIRLDIQVIDD